MSNLLRNFPLYPYRYFTPALCNSWCFEELSLQRVSRVNQHTSSLTSPISESVFIHSYSPLCAHCPCEINSFIPLLSFSNISEGREHLHALSDAHVTSFLRFPYSRFLWSTVLFLPLNPQSAGNRSLVVTFHSLLVS